MTKRFGFTLAEVLITLAIIGVVAAMTMPTLINNTNGAQFKTAYKKALSVLNQAVVMNIALDDYDLAGTSANSTKDEDTISLYRMFTNRTNGSLMSDDEVGTYKVTIADDGKTPTGEATAVPTTNYTFRFQDGIAFSFENTAAACTEANPCFGWIDANGTKGPNKTVACDSQDETSGECTGKVTINDIFPIKFYDQTVAPASAPARSVLYGSENMERTTTTGS